MNLHHFVIGAICIVIAADPIKSHSDEQMDVTPSMDLEWMDDPQYALEYLLGLWRDLKLGTLGKLGKISIFHFNENISTSTTEKNSDF